MKQGDQASKNVSRLQEQLEKFGEMRKVNLSASKRAILFQNEKIIK